jgi:hypothetical protein
MHVQRVNARPFLSAFSTAAYNNKPATPGPRLAPCCSLCSAGRFALCTMTARLLDAQTRRTSVARLAASHVRMLAYI